MTIRKRTVLASILIVLGVCILTACSIMEAGPFAQSGSTGTESADSTAKDDTGVSSGLITDPSGLDYTAMFTDRDVSPSWSATSAVKIQLDQDTVRIEGKGAQVEEKAVLISSGGTYLLSGTLEDGQIIVDVPLKEKVQLVLDGVDLTCSDSACILVKSADKVYITLPEEKENHLADTGEEYVQTDETMNVDAVVFSKADLVFNGEGSLSVDAGYHDAIVCKDDLKIAGGNYEIKSSDKGLVGKDSLRIKDGTFTILSQDDAMRTVNRELEGKGFVYIEGGDFSITTGGDAVYAATAFIVKDAMFHAVQCYNGVEADTIDIDGGTISVTAVDNGLKAGDGAGTDGAGSSADSADNGLQSSSYVRIGGGMIFLNADGDGIGAGGSIHIEGGQITVDGPTNEGNSALEAGTEIVIDGGTLLCAGSAKTAKETIGQGGQYCVRYVFPAAVRGGTEVKLLGRSGKTICSFTPSKDFSCLTLSLPSLKKGTYTLSAGDEEVQIEIDSPAVLIDARE